MGKLNRPPTVAQIDKQMRERPDATVNHEGGLAFKLSAKMELYKRVSAWMVNEPTFYDPSGSETRNAVDELIAKIAIDEPEFILQLAAYVRQEMYLRSAPAYLLARSVAYEGVRKLVPQFTHEIVRRADEICEVLGGYSALNPGKNVPKALKKGLANTLPRFNEYQLAKYDRKGEWTLRDALRVIRPKPKNEEERDLWGKVVAGKLSTPETWETAISSGGASKEAWEKIMPKMGIMALIRNLRNFLKHDCDITYAIDQLTDPKVIRNSKQFPYRFYSAYHAVMTSPDGNEFKRRKITDALITAIKMSVDNLPTLKGNTLIACDNSGSMKRAISQKSTISCAEVANLMGALAYGYCENPAVVAYGSEVVPVREMSIHDSPFTNMHKIGQTNTFGVATYAYKIVDFIEKANYDVDRIIVFTDEECYSNTRRSYGYLFGGGNTSENGFVSHMIRLRGKRRKPIHLYVFNLLAHGTSMMPEDDLHSYLISGYSDRVFSFMPQFETDPKIILESISNYIKTE